jgi:hypothetical protein
MLILIPALADKYALFYWSVLEQSAGDVTPRLMDTLLYLPKHTGVCMTSSGIP